MKHWLIALMMVSAPFATALGNDGGTSSGGGNALPRSSIDDVRSAVTQVFRIDINKVLSGLHGIAFPYDSKFTELLSMMFAGSDFDHSAIMDDLKKTKVVILSEGSCFDPYGGPTDASESESAQGPVICFSAPRLTRLSVEELPDQILALTFHEYAHYYGYGEADAVFVQQFLFAQLSSVCAITVSTKDDPTLPKISRTLQFQWRHKFDLNRSGEIIYEAKYRYNGGVIRLSSTDPGFRWDRTIDANSDSSRADFTYLDTDGSVKPGLLTWRNMRQLSDGSSQSVEAPVLQATIDGSVLEATSVSISKECFM